jgi:hypothetical protein
MGLIADRTKEHLGRTDMAVVAWRRAMLRAARELQASGRPPLAATAPINWHEVTAETFTFELDKTSWKEVMPLPAGLQPDISSAA